MQPIVDFNEVPIAKGYYYGGNAGAKNAVLYEGAVWMIKYPKSTRGLMNPQISYTTSPLSEYIGSKIYEILGIPVHETKLGTRGNKIVVACKDFTGRGERLVPFHDLKNSFMSSDLESYSGSGSETLLDEVIATIKGQDDLKTITGVMERFWDMFVVDAFIGNSDRNNGNWGILIGSGGEDISLAPVFDNGNAFFGKRSLAQMEKRIGDEKAMYEDACGTLVSAYKYTGLGNEGHRINPFAFFENGGNDDCREAVLRFLRRMDFGKIEGIIDEIPEVSGNLQVMPEVQKRFYVELMRVRFGELGRLAERESKSF